jgi:alpha/beta superfamily hydrolase
VTRVEFTTADGVVLEGELFEADGVRRGSAVVCHAHPEYGGSKDHPVLWHVRIALVRRGFAVLAFNFRGVMGSGGEFGGGDREIADARAGVERVAAGFEGPLLVAGWSFGARVALRTALEDTRIGALALLGMPVTRSRVEVPDLPPREALLAFTRPVLLVSGEFDEFSSGEDLLGLAGTLPEAEIEVLPGTDHYFPKREREVGALVAGFAERTLLGS